MKKILVISFFALLFVGNLHSQNRNEVKFNIAKSIFAFPEASYEYVLNRNMSVGTTLGFGVKPEKFMGYKFALSPYYRWFFAGNKITGQNASGFFLEANGFTFSQEIYLQRGEYSISIGDPIYIPGHPTHHTSIVKDTRHTVTKKVSGIGLGGAIGFKLVSKKQWVGEILGGVGYNFTPYKEKLYENPIYPHLAISIGKRF